MGPWLRRIRGALGLGVTWAVTGFAVGMGIEVIHNIWPNPLGGAVDIWPAALAYPGFFGGVAFAAVLGIAGRRRRFDELSVPRVAGWGALGGALVALVPAALVAVGLASPNVPILGLTAAIIGPFAVGGASAAAGSLWLARRSTASRGSAAEDEIDGVGLTDSERRELLGPER